MSNLRDVISHWGVVIGNHPFLIDKFLKAAYLAYENNPTEEETTAAKTATEEAYMATAFLSGLNKARYGALLNSSIASRTHTSQSLTLSWPSTWY